MALKLNGTTGILEYAGRVVSARPYARAMWLAVDGSQVGGMFAFGQSNTATGQIEGLLLDNNNQPIAFSRNAGGGSGSATKTASPQPNATLKLAICVFDAAGGRTIYFGNNTPVSDTFVAAHDLTLDNATTSGGSHYNGSFNYFNGSIAEDAFFDTTTWSGTTQIDALLAGSLSETIAGYIDSWDYQNFNSGGNYPSRGGTRTMVASGSVIQSSLAHPVARVAADTTPPTLASAAVSNSVPTVVALTMSEAMDTANVPAASAFTVSGHTVSSVAITGSTINLTVSAAFVNGEAARTVAYTQPGTANARDLAGNLLANFTGQAITNNVAAVDTTAPTFSSAQVANAAPANIVITMSETLAAFTPAASAFAVSGGKTVSSVARSGATITLTCSAAYAFGDTITVTYTKPGTNMLQDAAGNQTASFGPSSVTNNISSGASVTITSPSAGGKRVADGTYRAGVACNVTALDKTTHAVLERKSGLTSPTSGAFSFTSTVLTTGTERLFLVKADSDDKDIGMFFATPV